MPQNKYCLPIFFQLIFENFKFDLSPDMRIPDAHMLSAIILTRRVLHRLTVWKRETGLASRSEGPMLRSTPHRFKLTILMEEMLSSSNLIHGSVVRNYYIC